MNGSEDESRVEMTSLMAPTVRITEENGKRVESICDSTTQSIRPKPETGQTCPENEEPAKTRLADDKANLVPPVAPSHYGSTLGSTDTVMPESSTANLLKIDLERSISRHTGEEREVWDHRAEFILSLIGYAVGLGNVWRFPYLTQKNGGGAFLIPYAVMIVIEGIPLFYLELAVGQRLRKGAVGAWNEVSPYLGGLGLASVVVSFNVSLYYNTIMAWCLLYLVQSFQSPLPWAQCPSVRVGNSTVIDDECKRSGPTSYFWYRETLQIAPDLGSAPGFNLKLAAALLAAWVLIYLCMIKGIKSSGKVVYVTATFPYLVLVIFFFRGITLPGFDKGLEYLFVPEWSRLKDPQVWLDAATQIFYSFGLAFGCLIALSSYNPVRNNFVQETIIVSVADFFTSIFTAVVVFSILGSKATAAYEECIANLVGRENKTELGQLIIPENSTCDFKQFLEGSVSGTGLAFIVFTEAINQFPIPQLWSVLFFLMLLTLGLDSMFGMLEGGLTSINDMMLFPTLRKEILCGAVCLIMFLLSLSFATSTGPYVFNLFDSYSANIPLLIIAFLECVALSYIYGLKRFSEDVELMVGSRPSYFWSLCWRYVAPVAMLVIFLASVYEMFAQGTVYEVWDASMGTTMNLPMPWWCQLLAAMLVLISLLWIPGVAVCKYFKLVDWREEVPAFFPADELKEEHNIKPKKSNWFETYILGFKD